MNIQVWLDLGAWMVRSFSFSLSPHLSSSLFNVVYSFFPRGGKMIMSQVQAYISSYQQLQLLNSLMDYILMIFKNWASKMLWSRVMPSFSLQQMPQKAWKTLLSSYPGVSLYSLHLSILSIKKPWVFGRSLERSDSELCSQIYSVSTFTLYWLCDFGQTVWPLWDAISLPEKRE